MNEPLSEHDERLTGPADDIDLGTTTPVVVAFVVSLAFLLTGFLALGAEHLYLGAMALFVAAISTLLGTFWIIERLLQYRQHLRHGTRH
jgi:hypothetical protein